MSRLCALAPCRTLTVWSVTIRSVTIALLALVALGGCRQEAPPPELPPRAIQWQRVSASVANVQHVISGIVTAIS